MLTGAVRLQAMDSADDILFTCPSCEESINLNAEMMALILHEGCVVCGAPVSEAAFAGT